MCAYVCTCYCAISNAKNRVYVCVLSQEGVSRFKLETTALLAHASNERGLFSLSKGYSKLGGNVDRLSIVYRLVRILSHATKKLNVEESVE